MRKIQHEIKVIGLENINSIEYQSEIRNKVETIFGKKVSITIDELKNTIFNDSLNVDKKLKDEICSKIEKLAGPEIDMCEMQALLCLLDSSSEINNGDDKESRPEKYVFDTQVNISEKTGFLKLENDYNFNMLNECFKTLKNIINNVEKYYKLSKFYKM